MLGRLGSVRRVPPTLVAAALLVAALGVRMPAAAEPGDAPCDATQAEYVLNAKLTIADTMMGAGDGEYDIGPGSLVLRFERRDGKTTGKVELLSYEMRDLFVVTSKVLFWATSVQTDTTTRATPDACGVVATGKISHKKLSWASAVSGYRADGTLDCNGSFCGKFGAPPQGKSDFHLPPRPVKFKPFKFSKDMKTFRMASTFVSKAESPKHSTYVTLAGRETSRSCVAVKPCE